MNIQSVSEVIESITPIYSSGGSNYGIRVKLNANMLNYDEQTYRYKLGFAVDDVVDNAWPMPVRNLNTTGKIMVPNYGYPALPETIGEFVSRIPVEGDVQTNSIDFNLPGIAHPDWGISINVCVIDTDTYEPANSIITGNFYVEPFQP